MLAAINSIPQVTKNSILKLFVVCTVSLSFVSCGSSAKTKRAISGKYISWWGSTVWTYTFDTSGQYEYTAKGHCCFGTTKGTYRISGNTIYLKAFPKTEQLDSNYYVEQDTMLIKSDSCLLSVPLGYEHTLEDTTQKVRCESKRRNIAQKGYPILE